MSKYSMRAHRFGMAGWGGTPGYYEWGIFDSDQRRYIEVQDYDRSDSFPDFPEEYEDVERCINFVYDALGRHMDTFDPDVYMVRFDGEGRVVSTSTDPSYDHARGTHYAPVNVYAPPKHVSVLLRSDLTEVGRILHIDKVVFRDRSGDDRTAAFKHYHDSGGLKTFWYEAQVNLKLPPHPNLVLANYLVLEEVNQTGVVGFTMPFIPGGDLTCHRSTRPFKFKWLKQLTRTVDDLNLKYGVEHRDIAPRNLLVDAATDNLMLFDFGEALRVGDRQPGRSWQDRNDIKGVVWTVHDIITRPGGDPKGSNRWWLNMVDESTLLPRECWTKHADALLDRDVDIYYDFLMDWVRKRRAAPLLTHYTEAPEYLDFPDCMKVPEADWVDTVNLMLPVNGDSYSRRTARQHGRYFLEWTRPASSKLDRNRRLLATGRYADEPPYGKNGLVVDERGEGKDDVQEPAPGGGGALQSDQTTGEPAVDKTAEGKALAETGGQEDRLGPVGIGNAPEGAGSAQNSGLQPAQTDVSAAPEATSGNNKDFKPADTKTSMETLHAPSGQDAGPHRADPVTDAREAGPDKAPPPAPEDPATAQARSPEPVDAVMSNTPEAELSPPPPGERKPRAPRAPRAPAARERRTRKRRGQVATRFSARLAAKRAAANGNGATSV